MHRHRVKASPTRFDMVRSMRDDRQLDAVLDGVIRSEHRDVVIGVECRAATGVVHNDLATTPNSPSFVNG